MSVHPERGRGLAAEHHHQAATSGCAGPTRQPQPQEPRTARGVRDDQRIDMFMFRAMAITLYCCCHIPYLVVH